MTRIDRYILFLYFRVLVVCFCSIAGMLIVVDVFTNIEEFVQSGRANGNLAVVLADYYWPKLLAMFEFISGMLALLATLFVITWLYRTNELTALLAAGITKRRVIQPMMFASIAVIVLALLIRELAIPKLQSKLERLPQDLGGERPVAVRPVYDSELGIRFGGRNLLLSRREIIEPLIRVQRPPLAPALGKQIQASLAVHVTASSDHPPGYILRKVAMPSGIDSLASIHADDGKPLFMSHKDHTWLAPGECFLASQLDFDLLRDENNRYASTFGLIAILRSAQMLQDNGLRVQIHARILRPFVDWTVVLLGIPLVLSRPDQHMFRVAGSCLVLVAGFTAIVMGLNALGGTGYLLSPFLAAWLPLVVFLPWSATRVAAACQT